MALGENVIIVASTMKKQKDDPPSHESHEIKHDLGEVNLIEDSRKFMEELEQGKLHGVEAKIEKVIQYPLVAYEDSPTHEEGEKYPMRVEEPIVTPPLVPKEEEYNVEKDRILIPNEEEKKRNEDESVDKGEEFLTK
jgi:hypothetical protein